MSEKLLSKEEVLKRIGAPDFRSINHEQLISFVSALPDMDKEVAMHCIEQFPMYKDCATSIVNELNNTCVELSKDSKDIYKDVIESNQSILDSLSRLLESDTLSEESKMYITDKMIEVSHNLNDLAVEHGEQIMQTKKILAALAAFALTASAALLGLRFKK